MAEFQQQQQPLQPHVAVLAFPFGTHAVPLLNLTRRLASAAPHVTYTFFNTAKSNASILDDACVHNINVVNVDDGVPEGYVFRGKPHEDIDLFLSITPENFRKALSETNNKFTCLMTDAFLWNAADIAEEMKIPWLPFWTSAASALSTHLYTDLIRHTVGFDPSGREEEPLTFVPGMSSVLRVKDLPLGVLGGGMETIFSRLLHQMGRTITRATVITMNSFEELDISVINDLKQKFHQCLTLGPFSLTSPPSEHDPHGSLPWLSKQKPASVVYISFGTIATPPPNELAALAEALEESRALFLWSLKDGQTAHLPEGFLDRTSERGMVVPWTPQSQVLGHAATGVFVTHCGWNSVLESIAGGVPLICRPFFGDQKLNARLVSEVWGIGVEAKNGILSKDGVMKDLDLILHKEDGVTIRAKVVALSELAQQAVGSKGSSTTNFETLLKIVGSS